MKLSNRRDSRLRLPPSSLCTALLAAGILVSAFVRVQAAVVTMEPDTLWFEPGEIGTSQTRTFSVHGVSGYMAFTVMRNEYDDEFTHTPGVITTSPGSIDKITVTYIPTDYGSDTETYFLNPDFGDPPDDEVICIGAGPGPIRVCPDGSGDHDTIQAAIAAAADGAEIVLCDATYTGPGNRALDFLGKSITVRSASGDPDACVIDCQNAASGLEFLGGHYVPASLQGIGIRDASPHGMHFWQTHLLTVADCEIRSSSGLGVNCISDCDVDFSGCEFLGNKGGGVSVPGGNFEFTGCDFRDNTTPGNGAGLLVRGQADVLLTDCVFSGNETPGFGGGLAYYPAFAEAGTVRGSVRVNGGEFTENVAAQGGGAYCEWQATLEFDGTTVTGNSCAFGPNRAGGLSANGFATLSVANSLIAANEGNGIALTDHCDLILENSAVVDNGRAGIRTHGTDTLSVDCSIRLDGATIAYNAGHGLDIQSPVAPSEIARAIIAFNGGEGFRRIQATTLPIVCTDIHGNVDGDWSGDLLPYLGHFVNFDADPLFCDHSNGDYTLAAASPFLVENQPVGTACGLIGAFGLGCDDPTAVAEGPTLPAVLRWIPPRPNPFNPHVQIAFELSRGHTVSLAVHDLEGHRLAVLLDGRVGAGIHEATWDGRDASGRPMPSGIYVARLVTPSGTASGKLTLVR